MPSARVRPQAVPLQRQREAFGSFTAGAVILVLVLAVAPLLSAPHFVPLVTLVNTAAYQVNVEAKGRADGGWLDLGSVPRERETSIEGVVDQGQEWTFRFSSAGVFAGEMIVSRADLVRDHWRVNIPAGIAVPLQDAGLQPSAG